MTRTPSGALLIIGMAHLMILASAVGFPALMLIAEWRWRRTRDAAFLELVRRWQRAALASLSLAVVSATLVSIGLSDLWPAFMSRARPVIGMPWSVQGATLAAALLALAAFDRSRDRVSPRVHFALGALGVAFAASAGIVFIAFNAWLNTPAGVELAGGAVRSIHWGAAFFNPAAPEQAAHLVVGAYTVIGHAVAGACALAILRRGVSPRREATLAVALYLGAIGAILQPAFGHLSARFLARQQPEKFAAMEAVFFTEPMASLRIGGIPDERAGETPGALEFPMVLSMLLFDDPFAEVIGLDQVAPPDRPPVRSVYLAFQVMAILGSFVSIVASWVAWKWLKKQPIAGSRTLLWLLVVSAPMGLACLGAGWVATTLGREPWAIRGVVRAVEAYAGAHSTSLSYGVALLTVFAAGGALALLAREYQLAADARQ